MGYAVVASSAEDESQRLWLQAVLAVVSEDLVPAWAEPAAVVVHHWQGELLKSREGVRAE